MAANTNNNSAYQSFGQVRNGVKIWKFQNQKSAVDITHILNSYKEKIKVDEVSKKETKEMRYAGRLCFSVTSNGKYLKAYVEKKKAKTLFTSITNGMFSKIYPTGFVDFGGSVEDNKIFASKLEIKPVKLGDKNKIQIEIQKMPGTRTTTGAYKPSGAAIAKTNTLLDPDQFLEMAVEAGDFIKAAETTAMQLKIPMNTMLNYDFEKIGAMNTPTQGAVQETKQEPKQELTPQVLKEMDGRGFLTLYLKQKEEFDKYQEEYDRRMALKKEQEAAAAATSVAQ